MLYKISFRKTIFVSICMMFWLMARAENNQTQHWIARTDFTVNPSWQAPEVMNRSFWNIFHIRGYFFLEQMAGKAFRERSIYKESGKTYSSINIFNQDENSVTMSELFESSWPNFKKHHNLLFKDVFQKDYNPNVPFFLGSGESLRPPWGNLLGKHNYDFAGYQNFKGQYPNFIGFIQPEWCNECIILGPWREGGIQEHLKKRLSEEVLDSAMREFPSPSSRTEAISLVKKLFSVINQFYFNEPSKISSLRSYFNVDHYAYEYGSEIAWLETTNTGSYRWQPASFFIKGASHQYQKKWGWYLASYYNGYPAEGGKRVGDSQPNHFTARKISETYSWAGPFCGMSLSLYKRGMYLAYLSGPSFVTHENAMAKFVAKDGGLSPWGKELEEWFDFTRDNERGIPYSPVALLLPFDQCYPVPGGKSWMRYEYGRGDWMIDAFMFTIVPHNPNGTREGNEGCLSNSKYGDIFEVIVPDTPSEPVALDILGKYKAAVLLGNYAENEALADRMMEYVDKGGTLFINIKQLNNFFPEEFSGIKRSGEVLTVQSPLASVNKGKHIALQEKYELEKVTLSGAKAVLSDSRNNALVCFNQFGKGRVITTTTDYLVPVNTMSEQGFFNVLPEYVHEKSFPFAEYLLDQIVRESLPLEVIGDIEYGLNCLEDGWLLYLINNKGIQKFVDTIESVDLTKTATVQVMLRNLKCSEITDLREKTVVPLNASNHSFSVTVPSGDIKVIKIKVP